MERKVKKQEPIKKGGNKKGTRTQKMVSFRLDLDLVDYLDAVTNKGRFINNLIRARFSDQPRFEDCDQNPDDQNLDAWMP